MKRSHKFSFSKFSFKRSRLSAIIWSLVLGVYAYSKIVGYVKGYPTHAARVQIAAVMGKSSSLSVLVGPAYRLDTVAGYAVWSSYMFLILVSTIWGILLITKQLRGDEEAGRFDLILSAELTLKQLTIMTLNGIFKSLGLFFVILSLLLVSLGKVSGVDLKPAPLLFLAFSVGLAVYLFMMVAAVASQLMPTRKKANGLALAILGISLMIKAIADTSSLKWLLNFSPLGWFERLRPLEGSHIIWLIPILLLSTALYLLTIYLASKREPGESWFKEKTSYKPKLLLLGSLAGLGLRFNRGLILTWLAVVVVLNLLYGLLTKAAISAISGSPDYLKAIKHLSSSQGSEVGKAYVGAIFLINMLLFSIYTANCLNSLRHDELNSYDFNVLVEPISRIRYLVNKLVVQMSGLAVLALGLSFSFYIGELICGTQATSFSNLVVASLNAIFPSILVFGISLLMFGLMPRISNLVVFGLVIWSILISFLASGLKLNHYISDLSVFSHVRLAPSSNPDWRSNMILVGLALVVGLVGIYLYNRRDLIND